MRSAFPLLAAHPELSYLDSAATSQKPKVVIDRLQHYYAEENANVHRGIYQLSEQATRAFEGARREIARILGAAEEEIIFTRGTTEAINLVATILGRASLKPGDEIVLTMAEHHSNIVPWQIIATYVGAKIIYLPLDEHKRLDLKQAERLIGPRCRVLSLAHISNVLGIEHPLPALIAMAKAQGALTVIDGAQGIVHREVKVKELDCDFYAFSGHKVFGPTGIGVLYGKKALLESLPPYQGGGDMIETVSIEGSTWNALPSKFEAGTPNISGAIGLGEAMTFASQLDREHWRQHERHLGQMVLDAFRQEFPRVTALIEPADDWYGIVSFTHRDIHPHDIASICDSEGVCVRAGHHCAQPLMKQLHLTATTRVSPFVYNDERDIEKFLRALRKAEKLFA